MMGLTPGWAEALGKELAGRERRLVEEAASGPLPKVEPTRAGKVKRVFSAAGREAIRVASLKRWAKHRGEL